VEKGVSRRLQAARLRVGPPEPHADNTCRGGWGRPRGRRGRGGRAPGGPAPAARRRAATSEAAGGEGWITRSRGDRRPSGEGGGWTTQRSLRPSREKTSRTTRATFSKRMRGSPSAPVSAGGRSFEEVFNAVLAGRAGHGVGGGGRHILHGRGVPETARSKTGSASSISHRQWRNRLNAGGESWEAGHGRQAGAHRSQITPSQPDKSVRHIQRHLPRRKIDTINNETKRV
jgi:hypothetical protein